MDNRNTKLKFGYGFLAAVFTFALPTAHADDLEVFVNANLSGVAPNLVFALDLSDSMNKTPSGGTPNATSPSRLDILKQAMSDVMNDPTLPEINVGLTYFRYTLGSGIKFPASRLNSDANTIDAGIPTGTLVKDVIEGMVAGYDAQYATPTVDSLHEIARYLRGEHPTLGRYETFGTWDSGSNRYAGGTMSAGMDGWLAANPVSYTGSLTYLALTDPQGYTASCDDDTVSTPPGTSNACWEEQAAGAPMSCTAIGTPAQVCNSTTCDAGCGQSCPSGFNYSQPANCIVNSSGNLWVTGTDSSTGAANQCCSQADAGLNECIAYTSYPSSCSSAVCNVANNKPASFFNRCTYREYDTRKYISPITQQCQKTAVVVLTDGDPSANWVDRGQVSGGTALWPYRIRDMIASADPAKSVNDITCDDYSDEFGAAPGAQPFANCAKELAKFMHDEDQIPALSGSTVDTYAVGFGLAGPAAVATWGYLQDVTSAGGGSAIEATDLKTLVDAFRAIITSVSSDNQNFSGFTTSLDTRTLQTGDKTYVSVFSPKDERTWDGNIKGYYIVQGQIKDVTGADATEVDATTGEVEFKDTARSFWSGSADGNLVLAGGALDNLKPATRSIYVITNPAQVAGVDLNDGNHDLNNSNAGLTAGIMGMPASSTPSDVSDMIKWTRSRRLGDPLHSEPRTVRYSDAIGEVLYVTTNQGYLHAINVKNPTAPGDYSGGNEMFAFLPNQLIGKVQEQRAGNVSGSHIYGIDGPMTVLLKDLDGNGKIDGGGEKAYLYFGMRRGGGSYFAMDVSDPNDPRLAWQINAGAPGYERLGETWSRMTLATVDDGGTPRDVLIFGGGYHSASQDVANTSTDVNGDPTGMGIYVVDAKSGALLNSIGADDLATPSPDFKTAYPNMKYGIPSDVRAEDTDSNGFADRLYVADMGGQLWRVDIVEGGSISAGTTLKPYVFADLGGAGTAGNRRFYYPPSVAHTARNAGTVTALAIGSGYRAHPLDGAIDDKFYLLFDPNVTTGPPASTPAPLTIGNLFDASSNIIQTSTGATQTAAIAALGAKDGWYITLPGDQKVLARARIFKNRVFFNAFESAAADPCDFAGGLNRFYAVNLADATGAIEVDLDNDGTPDDYTRETVVDDQSAILASPTIVTHTEPGPPTDPDPFCSTVFAGSQAVMQICDNPVRVNWQSLQ